jgi:aspartate/methionine/tyrosine aminotransferase
MIKESYEKVLERLGIEPRALVLTNPQNPVGLNYAPELLEDTYQWVLQHTGMQIISDEIYAHSQVQGGYPRFVSALALDISKDSEFIDRVHVAWGFAKDFGTSGFRVGTLLSRSADVHTKVREFSYYSPLNSMSALMLKKVLTSDKVDFSLSIDAVNVERGLSILREYQQRLTHQHDETRRMLEEHGIPFFDSNAAQFFWLDLQRYLGRVRAKHEEYASILRDSPEFLHFPQSAGSFVGVNDIDLLSFPPFEDDPENDEKQLNEYITNVARISLLPGTTLSSTFAGFFRMCYTGQKLPVIGEAIGRLADALSVL